MNKKTYYHFDNIQLIPNIINDIKSRSEITVNYKEKTLTNYIISSPMDTVFNKENINYLHSFVKNNIPIALPRNFKINDYPLLEYSLNANFIVSIGLADIDKYILSENTEHFDKIYSHYTKYNSLIILLDIANGHIYQNLALLNEVKRKYPLIKTMAGNIANAETLKYYDIYDIDYARIGIGTGSSCTTSTLTGVGLPLAGLIEECRNKVKRHNLNVQLVADGGISKTRDIIKALNLGADYVMLGGALNKAVESAGKKFIINGNNKEITINFKDYDKTEIQKWINKRILFSKFRGMSTKSVQKDWGNKEIKYSEGKYLNNKVEYFLDDFVAHTNHMLKTSMSYLNCRTLEEFVGKQRYGFVTSEYINETLNKKINDK